MREEITCINMQDGEHKAGLPRGVARRLPARDSAYRLTGPAAICGRPGRRGAFAAPRSLLFHGRRATVHGRAVAALAIIAADLDGRRHARPGLDSGEINGDR
jgi:hypothetical protein